LSELRWNPLRREWVITATHRMDRVLHPPRDYCPLCPTVPGGFETEIPRPDFELAVFENRFPSLHLVPPEPDVDGTELSPVAPAGGVCEVVVYTPEHEGSIATLSLERVIQLIYVWQDRYREISRREGIRYILIFENRGPEVGVTLSHPHGQIYAFPFIPPVPELELASARAYRQKRGRCLFCDLLAEEIADGRRIIMESSGWVAFVPFAARYSYEVHLYSRRCLASLTELNTTEVVQLAKMLQELVACYDRLFDAPFPYLMILHQAPVQAGSGDERGHLHFEFYSPVRDRDKLKFLAGCEQGAGTFINDAAPEKKAAELRACLDKKQV
jgi:UDPglucose--hexose-1-phosphate uridylyltransferase